MQIALPFFIIKNQKATLLDTYYIKYCAVVKKEPRLCTIFLSKRKIDITALFIFCFKLL